MLMFRNIVTNTVIMALAGFNQGSIHLIETAGIVHVVAPIAVIEVRVNHQDAAVMAMVISRRNPLLCWNYGTPDHLMEKCPQNKKVSTIKTKLAGIGIYENFASLLASILIPTTADNNQGSLAGNCHTDSDNIHHSTPIRTVNMEDVICHEAEEIVITNFISSQSMTLKIPTQKI